MYNAELKNDIYRKAKELGADIVRTCSVECWESRRWYNWCQS